MEALKIFLVVMSCSSDFLYCENISRTTAFSNMDLCHEAREQTLRGERGMRHFDNVLLARCQYVLAKTAQAEEPAAGERRSADRLAW